MKTDKRAYQRKKVPSTCATIHGTEGYHNAMIADISLKGMSLLAGPKELNYGECYHLKFNLPVRGRYLPVQLEGKALYSIPHALGPRVGLQVSSIDTLSLWTVEAFIKAAGESELPFTF